MAFSEESILAAKNIITARRLKADADAAKRLSETHALCPELKELDAQYPRIGRDIVYAFTEPATASEAIEALHKESDALDAKREKLLASIGLKSDYTSPRYFCSKCSDTGYLEFKMCACMKKELIKLAYQSSGLGALIGKQTFENFSLDYYDGEDKLTMAMNLEIAKSFASNFGDEPISLLMTGNTGLGKTHLSTAIAGTVIEKGYDVLYETSENLISAFSFERFGRGYGDTSESRTERFFNCDLLIIDDFGTEVSNQFSVSCFYNLINTRTCKSLSTVINTNLTRDQIRTRYTDRIASRLFGEFAVLSFRGTGDEKDIRMKKLN